MKCNVANDKLWSVIKKRRNVLSSLENVVQTKHMIKTDGRVGERD